MTEAEYLTRIEELWPSEISQSQWVENHPLYEDLESQVKCALTDHPQSSPLWCIKGDLLQLLSRPWDDTFDPPSFLHCYQMAIKFDPANWYAWESLAVILDIYYGNLRKAETLFAKAISLGAGASSFLGRARAVAELGHREEALRLLSSERCPFAHDADIAALREEIIAGDWDPLGIKEE